MRAHLTTATDMPVITVNLPPFQKAPEALVWGSRVFLWKGTEPGAYAGDLEPDAPVVQVYREGFAFCVDPLLQPESNPGLPMVGFHTMTTEIQVQDRNQHRAVMGDHARKLPQLREGWEMPQPPVEGALPVASCPDDWDLTWCLPDVVAEDGTPITWARVYIDNYLQTIPWPFGPDDKAEPSDLAALGFTVDE